MKCHKCDDKQPTVKRIHGEDGRSYWEISCECRTVKHPWFNEAIEEYEMGDEYES